MASSTKLEALLKPLDPRNTWDICNKIIQKGNIKQASKLIELVASALETANLFVPELDFDVFLTTKEVVKNVSKFTVDTEGLANQLKTKIWDGGRISGGPLTEDYIDHEITLSIPTLNTGSGFTLTNWSFTPILTVKPAFIIKASLITTASVCQAYCIGKKYIHPELFAKVGDIFVTSIHFLVSQTGSERITFVAEVITSSGAGVIKNYTLVGFLVFEVYQGCRRYYVHEGEDQVYDWLKTTANVCKVGMIGMAIVGGAPAWLMVGGGLITSYVTIAEIYQKLTKAPGGAPGGAPAAAADPEDEPEGPGGAPVGGVAVLPPLPEDVGEEGEEAV